MSDLTDLDDIRQQAALLHTKERRARAFSWLSLGQSLAYLLLVAAFGIWLRAYLFQIEPQLAIWDGAHWQTTASMLLNGALDSLMVIAGAAASAIAPPLLISAVIPNTPAALVISRLKVRYGWPGLLFPVAGGLFMAYLSFEVLQAFWASRPSLWLDGNQKTPDWPGVNRAAIFWSLLLIGFPSWALNQLTPAQWVDALLDSILASRIHLALDLQEEIAAAIKVRAKALLYADVATMTVEEREQNGRQIAALQAGILRDLKRSMQHVLGAADTRHNMALIVMPSDKAIIDRHRQLAGALAGTIADVEVRTDYIEVMAAPALPRPSIRQQNAVTEASADASVRSPRDPQGPRTLPQTQYQDELQIAWRVFGQQSFTRDSLEDALDCAKSKAAACIAAWRRDGAVRELTETKHHYALTEEVVLWLK